MKEKFITIFKMSEPRGLPIGISIHEAVAEHLELKHGQFVSESVFREAVQESYNYGIAKCDLNIAMEKGLPE